MNFTIGELEKLTGMNRTTLRYYDAEGLIDPARLENGYRKYSEMDVMSLVQLKQLNAFGVELSELPGVNRKITVKDIHRSLVGKEQAIEREIEELYQKLSRLRLHVDAFQECTTEKTEITESRMVGAYRLYFHGSESDPPETAKIFKRWMNDVPDTYSVIRIPKQALGLPQEAFCPVEAGIGLLSGAFQRLHEVYEEPIEYTPPCKCIQGMIRTRRLDRIQRSVLQPFEEFIAEHGLIPLGDFYGWVVYTPADHEHDCFHISMRLGIN